MKRLFISMVLILLCSSAYAKIYIVNSENEVMAKCSYMPNVEDLESRGEIMVVSDLDIEILDAEYRGGKIKIYEPTTKEKKAVLKAKQKAQKIAERKQKIQDRSYKIAEQQLIEEGILEVE